MSVHKTISPDSFDRLMRYITLGEIEAWVQECYEQGATPGKQVKLKHADLSVELVLMSDGGWWDGVGDYPSSK